MPFLGRNVIRLTTPGIINKQVDFLTLTGLRSYHFRSLIGGRGMAPTRCNAWRSRLVLCFLTLLYVDHALYA